MKRLAPWPYFLAALLVFAATGALLHARNSMETVPSHRNLNLFPNVFANWTGEELPLSAGQLAVLGPGDYLMRDYHQEHGQLVNLFLAYYPSQRSGDTIHSPQNCLPGAGWTPLKSGRTEIEGPGNTRITVNRYVVGQGTARMLALYWYQAHGRVTPSEYWAKIFLVKDAIEMNRTDGALVRVMVPYDDARDEARAETQALSFTQQILPVLDSYIPR